MEKSEIQSNAVAHRKILSMVVSSTLQEIGIDSTDKVVLETLTEMLQSCKIKLF